MLFILLVLDIYFYTHKCVVSSYSVFRFCSHRVYRGPSWSVTSISFISQLALVTCRQFADFEQKILSDLSHPGPHCGWIRRVLLFRLDKTEIIIIGQLRIGEKSKCLYMPISNV